MKRKHLNLGSAMVTHSRGVKLPALAPTSEKKFMERVRQLAALYGWLFFHVHDSRGSEPGFPDCVLVRERVIYAELKKQDGKMTPEQEIWFERLRKAGAEVYVFRPSDLEKIEEILQ